MGHEYKPHGLYDAAFTPEQCKSAVHRGGRAVGFYQCQRKPWKDGWCKQHHPDTEAKRRAESKLRSQQRTERRLGFLLQKSREEVAWLKARIAELEASE